MRFLANENVPRSSIFHLRAVGHTVIALAEENPGIPDHEVLLRAAREYLIIITFDRIMAN